MSGFVGVVSADDAPIDRRLLHQLTQSLSFRGPDAQELWTDGPVGFGHAMLRTTPESQHERQPQTVDGAVWITGDVRVDGRADLIGKLESDGCRHPLRTAADAELVLHAYQSWGEDCVKQLLGDFAFAIWDGRTKRLFCARDYFGVKPFYYAHTARGFVFSNTLNCVRLHPAVSDGLNDSAVGDFLLFGYNQEPTTTTFTDIQRLPPAHALTWSAGSLIVRRYWTLPSEGRVRYRRANDYVDHFRELWRTAVEDRLRTDSVGVLMSGGLDSSSVAVMAHDVLSARQEPFDLRAYTLVYDRLIPDEERHYAGQVAEALGIPIHYLPLDDYALFDRWEEPGCQTPEPADNPLPAMTVDAFRLIARRCRVGLSGDGGDAAFHTPPGRNFVNLLVAGQPGTLVSDVARCLAHGQRPPLGLRAALERWRGNGSWRPAYPGWISKEFEARLDLRERWEELTRPPASLDSQRSGAYRTLHAPFWTYLFETYDPSYTLCPVIFRHPFFDVRLLTYLLAMPPMPWFLNKKLLRDAMRGSTPEPVRQRIKRPTGAEPIFALLGQPQARWVNHVDQAPRLVEYVDFEKIPKVAGLPMQGDHYKSNWHLVTRPLCLNHWLAHVASRRPAK